MEVIFTSYFYHSTLLGGDNLLKKMAIATSKLINTKNLRALVNWAEENTENVNSEINSLARRNLALALANTNANANANANTNSNTIANAIAYAITIANANANTNTIANAIANINTIAYACANAIANVFTNAIANANAIASTQSIELVDDLSELQIFDRLDCPDIKTKFQALEKQIPDGSQPMSVHQKFSKNILQIWCQSLRIEMDWLNLSASEIQNFDQYFSANLLIIQCKEAAVYVSSKGWAEVEEMMFRLIPIDDGW
jgi:hypothetical protein